MTDSHREHLRRGFNWLGGATIAAKVIDFSTILIVLLFLTKQQVGTASIVISIAMVGVLLLLLVLRPRALAGRHDKG